MQSSDCGIGSADRGAHPSRELPLARTYTERADRNNVRTSSPESRAPNLEIQFLQ